MKIHQELVLFLTVFDIFVSPADDLPDPECDNINAVDFVCEGHFS